MNARSFKKYINKGNENNSEKILSREYNKNNIKGVSDVEKPLLNKNYEKQIINKN